MLSAAPTFSGMQFDGRTIVGDDYIEPKPTITVFVTGNNLDFNAFQLYIDDLPVLTSANPNYVYTNGVLRFRVSDSLSNGLHKFQARALDLADGISQLSIAEYAYVATAKLELAEAPIVYPSPATSSARICYSLTYGTDIDICIYDLKGQLVYHDRVPNGEEGAHAGYNQYVYNLSYADQRLLANGVYLVFIMQRSGDKVNILGKRKFMVLRDEK